MILKSLSLENFLCFGRKITIDFPEEFNAIIIGRNHLNPAKSNGTGKSAFLDSIPFLFWGKTRSDYNRDIPNDNLDSAAFVGGIFNLEGKDISVRRTISKEGNADFNIKGWDKFEKSIQQKKLEKMIGYTYEEFMRTFFFSQGDIHQFMEAKPAAKIQMLQDWLEIINWQEQYDLIYKEIQEIKTKLKNEDDDIDALIEERRKMIGMDKKRLGELREKEERLSNRLNKMMDKHKDAIRYQEINSQLSELKREQKPEELEVNTNKLNKLKLQIEKINDAIKEHEDLIDRDLEESKKYKNLISEIKQLEKEMEKSRNNINQKKVNLTSYSQGICPIDGKKCVGISKSSKSILEKEIEKLEEKHCDMIDGCEILVGQRTKFDIQLTANEDAEKRIKEYDAKKKDLEYQVKLTEQRVQSITDRSEKINKLKKKLKDVNVSEGEGEIRDSIENLDTEIRDCTSEIGSLDNSLEQLEKELEEYEESKEEMERLKKRLEILNLAIYIFGRNGIKAWQLQQRLEEIEITANTILKELETPLQIKIRTHRETKVKESICPICSRKFESKKCICGCERGLKKKEEFEINIVNLGKERRFNSESGGNKILASLALRLALIQIKKEITGREFNMLFLDEIYGMLDKYNRHNVYSFLMDYVRNVLGFKQIFQITHTNDSKLEGDFKIEITQYETYSEARKV